MEEILWEEYFWRKDVLNEYYISKYWKCEAEGSQLLKINDCS